VLGIVLAAHLLLPLLAEAPRVSRTKSDYAFFLTDRPQTPRRLVALLHPEALGTPLRGTYPPTELWEDSAYFGIIPLVLAVTGCVLGWRRRDTPFLAGSFAACLLLSFDSPILHTVYVIVPGFSLFREPGRFFFMAAFFGMALAGIGLQECVERLRQGRWNRRAPVVLATVLIALIAVEGAWYACRYVRMIPQEDILPGGDAAKVLAQDRGLFRIANAPRSSLNYGWAAHLGLQLATGYDPYNYRYYQAYFDILRFGELHPARGRVWVDLTAVSRPDLLDALNVKYLVLRPGVGVGTGRFPLVARLKDQQLFSLYSGFSRGDLEIRRNRSALRRVFFPKSIRVTADERQAVEIVKAVDLHDVAVIEAKAAPNAEAPQPGDAMRISEAYGGKLRFQTRTSGPRFAVISEIWNPGWQARIDGQPVPLYKTNIALLGLPVPGGEHTVELDFRPELWGLGIAFSTCGVVALSVLSVLALRRRVTGSSSANRGT
jgi:hypothetical protein